MISVFQPNKTLWNYKKLLFVLFFLFLLHDCVVVFFEVSIYAGDGKHTIISFEFTQRYMLIKWSCRRLEVFHCLFFISMNQHLGARGKRFIYIMIIYIIGLKGLTVRHNHLFFFTEFYDIQELLHLLWVATIWRWKSFLNEF